MNITEIIQNKQGTVVDVRNPEEFHLGNVPGSVNIPLKEIPKRMEEIKNLRTPLVLCCASGNRSSQAHQHLSEQGIECYNGGSWSEVNQTASQTTLK